MEIKYTKNAKTFAKELRKNVTVSEELLWAELKGQKLGLKFNRQQPVGKYTVDFLCRKERIFIEIDGDSHDGKTEYDETRDEFLKSQGLLINHIHDHEVKKNIGGVLQFIKDSIKTRTSSKVISRY